MVGYLAISLAGHDKNRLYMIMEETKETVMLSDGNIRPISRMKCKKKKHIQIVKKIIDEELTGKIRSGTECRNEEIKYALKIYQQSLEKK